MDALSELLKRIPIPGLKESNERHIIARAISDTVGIKVSAHQVSFKEGVLIFSLPPVLKSAIHMRKQELKQLLTDKGIEVREIK